jgi:hypothetical protein
MYKGTRHDNQFKVTYNVSGGGVSTNSVEDRGQIQRGIGGGSPLVRGSALFANG